jgi:hypothetical protein
MALALGIAVLGLTSCQRATAGAAALSSIPSAPAPPRAETEAPLSTLRAPLFRYRFCIYTDAKPPVDAAPALATAAATHGFKLVSQPVGRELPPLFSSIFMAQPTIDQFPPPSPESLEFFAAKLTEPERRRLSASTAVAVFEVVGPGRRAFEDYRESLKLGQELAGKLGGLLWDDETRTAHSVASLNERLASWEHGVPFVNDHVALHEYRDGELFRIVSLGMIKFGLPDLAVNQVAGKDADRMGRLANLVLQALLEGATPDAAQSLPLSLDEVRHGKMQDWLAPHVSANAKRKVVLSLTRSVPQEGDSENRLLEVAFAGDPARTQERQTASLASLFGSEDAVLYLQHDAALLAASARARKKAFALRERFAKGPPFGEQLLVKAPFQTAAGDNEWMWVEVVSWQADTIDGIVTEDAFDIPTLKGGARVQVQADRIFDYLLLKRDGSREGNETQPLLDARASSRRDKP